MQGTEKTAVEDRQLLRRAKGGLGRHRIYWGPYRGDSCHLAGERWLACIGVVGLSYVVLCWVVAHDR